MSAEPMNPELATELAAVHAQIRDGVRDLTADIERGEATHDADTALGRAELERAREQLKHRMAAEVAFSAALAAGSMDAIRALDAEIVAAIPAVAALLATAETCH